MLIHYKIKDILRIIIGFVICGVRCIVDINIELAKECVNFSTNSGLYIFFGPQWLVRFA